MEIKLLTKLTSSITGAALVIGASSLASRLLGLVRDRLFAHTFGASPILDAYYAAFKIPDFVYNLIIVGALSAGFIPVFSTILHKYGKEEAQKVYASMSTIIAVTLTVLAATLIVLAQHIVPLFTPGFSLDQQNLTITLTRILAISPLLLGLSGIAGGVLQTLKHFVAFSLAPVCYNVGIIFGITILYPLCGISGLAIGVVVGALFHSAIQLIAAKNAGFPLTFTTHINKAMRTIGLLMIPRTLALSLANINLIAITALLSTTTTGSISSLQFATNIISVPLGLFAVSYAIAAFPRMNESAATNNFDTLQSIIIASLRQILFLLIPVTMLMIVLRAQIVRVLLGSGAFTWEDTRMTFDMLGALSLSVIAQGLIHILARALYALHNTILPFFAVLIGELTTFALAYYFVVSGYDSQFVAIAISVGSTLQLAFLFVALKHKLKHLEITTLLKGLFVMSSAALFAGICAQLLKLPISQMVDMTTAMGILIQMTVCSVVALTVYLVITHLLKLPESRAYTIAITQKLTRKTNVPPNINDSLN